MNRPVAVPQYIFKNLADPVKERLAGFRQKHIRERKGLFVRTEGDHSLFLNGQLFFAFLRQPEKGGFLIFLQVLIVQTAGLTAVRAITSSKSFPPRCVSPLTATISITFSK